MVSVAKGISGASIRQLGNSPYIPSDQVRHRLLSLAPEHIELPNSFRLAFGAVPHRGIAVDSAAINAKIGKLAHIGVSAGFEHLGRQGGGGVEGDSFLLLGSMVYRPDLVPVFRGRQVVAKGIKHHFDAHVL